MSDKKISQLPAASDTDVGSSASYEIPVVVNGTTKKVSNSQVLAPVRQELQSTASQVTQLSSKVSELAGGEIEVSVVDSTFVELSSPIAAGTVISAVTSPGQFFYVNYQRDNSTNVELKRSGLLPYVAEFEIKYVKANASGTAKITIGGMADQIESLADSVSDISSSLTTCSTRVETVNTNLSKGIADVKVALDGVYTLNWELGTISSDNGADVSSSERIRTIGFIPAGTYYLTIPDGYSLYVFKYNGSTFAGRDNAMTSSCVIDQPNNKFRLLAKKTSGTITVADAADFGFSVSGSIADELDSVKERMTDIDGLGNALTEPIYDTVVSSMGENCDFRAILFTDNHNYESAKYKKYTLFMKEGVLDCQISLGDIPDYDYTRNLSDVRKLLLSSVNMAGRGDRCFYVIGNHDVSPKNQSTSNFNQSNLFTPRQDFDIFLRHLDGNVVFDQQNPMGGYYYRDFASSKIRAIFLNSSDIFDGSTARCYKQTLRISNTQLEWFANKALNFSSVSDASSWAVVVFVHEYNAFTDQAINPIFEFLSAFKSGSSYSYQRTIYRRYVSGSLDNTNGDTYNVSANYSQQGAIDVIALVHGHNHVDNSSVKSGINRIQIRCDNSHIDDMYVATLNGLAAGSYYYVTGKGTMFKFTIESAISTAVRCAYNNYLAADSSLELIFYGSDNKSIQSASTTKVTSVPAGHTLISGFVAERDGTAVKNESCEIMCINKSAKTIKFLPFGAGYQREFTY